MLSLEALKKIDRAIAKYPAEQKQSAVMHALAVAQAEKGWLSPKVMQFVADYLEMPAVAVQEVATFYTMFNTSPVGKFKLTVCTNLTCQLMRGEEIAKYLKEKLGVEYGDITPDALFTIKEGECMGACGDAPVMLVNNHRMYGFMSEERVDALIDELKTKGAAGEGA